MSSASQTGKKWLNKLSKAIMKSHHFRIPKYDLPIRLRPWFLALTCMIMVLLAFLGFTNFSRSLPLNDKLLHFLCFGVATGVFYFIVDVEEHARRIWFWRYSGLIFTIFTCFFCGGILSEVVQSALPYKEFQIGDVLANLLGSSLGLGIAYHLEKYYRRRREIAQLYRPLDADYSDNDEDDDDSNVAMLLPIHTNHGTAPKSKKSKTVRFADVWDEPLTSETFGIGGESDEEADVDASTSNSTQPPSPVPDPAGKGKQTAKSDP